MDTRTGEIFPLTAKQIRELNEEPGNEGRFVPVNNLPNGSCQRCKGRGAVRAGMFSRRFRPCRCTMTEPQMKTRIAEGKRL